MDKVWVIEDPSKLLHGLKARSMPQKVLLSNEKDPAKAYSLSVLFWGGGQFYNKNVVKGLSLILTMAAFYTGTAVTVLSWSGIVRFLQGRGMSVSVFILVALGLLFCVLIFSSLCCSNAYHKAAKTRRRRFNGTRSRVFPFLCSLLLPGWGQFLNGQPLKGGIFAGFTVASYFSLIAVPVVLLAWKDLEPSSARFLVESVFTISALFLPLIPFVWLFGSYDALKVGLEEWKKEPLRERIKAVKNLRSKVCVRRVFRRIRWTFILVLLLAFFMVVVYNYFPLRFYADELVSVRSWLQAQGMTLLPDLLGRLSTAAAGWI
jgi:TM2 domain-containing membrane protein YozV